MFEPEHEKQDSLVSRLKNKVSPQAVVRRCSAKKLFQIISQNL